MVWQMYSIDVINSRITLTMDENKDAKQVLDVTIIRDCEYTADEINIKAK